jgi:hypothetical protein
MAGRLRRRDHRHVADDTLDALGAELRRVRARCRRFKREADIVATTIAWKAWSEEVERLEVLFCKIAERTISTVQDIATRYEALAVELVDGDLILELGAQRRAARLNRDLQQLVRRQSSQ